MSFLNDFEILKIKNKEMKKSLKNKFIKKICQNLIIKNLFF